MVNQTRNTATPYTEEQTKIWLSRLARGMQQHGQTVFMIEQLQPSWLASSYERMFYILITRIISGLLLGLIIAAREFEGHDVQVNLFSGFFFGLSIGLFDLSRASNGLHSSLAKPSWWRRTKGVLMVGVVLVLVWCVLSSVANNVFVSHKIFNWEVFLLLAILAITWGIRRSQRTLASEIQCVETLTWSWTAAALGAVRTLTTGGVLGIIIGVIFGLQFTEDWSILIVLPIFAVFSGFVSLILFAIPAIIFATFSGLQTGVKEMKTVPNQGIKLSVRSAVYGGLLSGMSFGSILIMTLVFSALVWHFPNYPVSDWVSSPLIAGLAKALFFGGLLVAFVGGSWFGGIDFLMHYLLRLMLYGSGRMPLNLVRFLDYAARDLNFLQKVGGGYIFIHRMLLEHFAAMVNEGMSSLQNAPTLAASSPITSAPDNS